MKQELVQIPIGEVEIRERIKTIRGVQVMLDRDLAELYNVETKQLKRQVKRNIRRFPSDFMIELSERDMKSLRCQIGTSNRGGDRYGAYAFTLRYVSRLVESAKSEILIIDPYSDVTILDVLAKKQSGVTVRLICKDRGKPTATEIAKFNRQYKGLTVSYSDDFHDRFVIVDNVELHNFGSSVNCHGRRVSTYSTRDAKEIKKLLALLP